MHEVLLSKSDEQKLEEYRVCFKKMKATPLTIPVAQLFDRGQLQDFLEKVQKALQAPNLMVAASAFSKRYSYLMVVPAIYSFLMLNKQLNMSVNNLSLMSSASLDKWLPSIYLQDQKVFYPDSKVERENSRNQLFDAVFVQHLSLLWDNISELCKIPKPILWENTAVYTFWIFETLLQQKRISSDLRDNIQGDFNFLLHESQNTIFKNFNTNPLTPYYCDKTSLDGQDVRIRKTCCFYYELSEERQTCKGCPKKSVNECLQEIIQPIYK